MVCGLLFKGESNLTQRGAKDPWRAGGSSHVGSNWRMYLWAYPPLGKVGENFPTSILNHEIDLGISPVKSQFRPDLDSLKFDVGFFSHKMWPLPKNN